MTQNLEKLRRLCEATLSESGPIKMSNSAGTKEEYDRVWPVVSGWHLSDGHEDEAGAYEATYSLDERGQFLEVYFAHQYWWSSQHKYRNRHENKWNGPEDIHQILAKMLKDLKDEQAAIAKSLKSVAGQRWKTDGDTTFLTYWIDDADHEEHMLVTFDDVEDMLRDGKPQSAKMEFTSHSDYDGLHGQKSKTVRYGSVADIKKILKDAEVWYDQMVSDRNRKYGR